MEIIEKTKRAETKLTMSKYKCLKVLTRIDGKSISQYLSDLVNADVKNRWEEIKVYRDSHQEEIRNMK
jgi:hypothetical protein